ncbi:MAG TPA: GAF domain-containing protein [Solirubrobacterales bacterium]|nr:GAF domain-containing protein [Solirubrobacterales bacterium]
MGLIEALSDTLLDPILPFPGDAILVALGVLVLTILLSGAYYRRIDALGAAVSARNRALEQRATSAAAMHRVSVAIAALADLRSILDAIAEHARTLSGADVAVILLVDAGGRLRRAAASGPVRDEEDAGLGSAIGSPPAGATAARSALDPDEVLRFLPAELATSRLASALNRGPETIGLLAIGSRTTRSFDADTVETLASLANQASIAIENARLQARLRELAVETERERIAREMHDGLAQVLGYVSTKSQAADELLANGRVVEARGQLGELTAAARSIYVDVREAILGLRSPITPELGLVGAIEDYAVRFAEASKLAVSVEAAADVDAAGLGPETEAQIFRIVQESLTNVRKHAAAGRVVIHLRRIGDELVIELVDDGRGFDRPSPWPSSDWPHYGQAAMRERADAIGAEIAWGTSATGGGFLRLAVPLRRLAVEEAG